jgi:hypothetical protein
VFSLSTAAERLLAKDVAARDFSVSVGKLASAFKVDEVRLMSQINDHVTMARLHFEKTKCSQLEAWLHVVAVSTKKSRPNVDLKEVLYRYATFRACTSRIEQDFSLVENLMGNKRLHQLEEREADVIKVLVDRPKDSAGRLEILKHAQKVWIRHFGVPRASSQHWKRARGEVPGDPSTCTLTEFQRKRRREMLEVTRGASSEAIAT